MIVAKPGLLRRNKVSYPYYLGIGDKNTVHIRLIEDRIDFICGVNFEIRESLEEFEYVTCHKCQRIYLALQKV